MITHEKNKKKKPNIMRYIFAGFFYLSEQISFTLNEKIFIQLFRPGLGLLTELVEWVEELVLGLFRKRGGVPSLLSLLQLRLKLFLLLEELVIRLIFDGVRGLEEHVVKIEGTFDFGLQVRVLKSENIVRTCLIGTAVVAQGGRNDLVLLLVLVGVQVRMQRLLTGRL